MRAARIFLLFFAIIQNIVIYASSIHILLTSMFCHHRISFMQLGHLFTRSGLTYSEVSSKVCHDSFCQLGSSISLPWVIYFEAFYLHVVSSFSCIPVICPKLVLFITRSQFVSIWVVKRNTIAYPTQQSSSPSRGIPCSHKRGNDERVTAV